MSIWRKIRLGDIIKVNQSTYSTKEKWKFVNYLDTGNITMNNVDKIQFFNTSTDKLPSRARRKVQFNSIIYSTVRPNQLHYGIIKNQPDNFLVSTGFAVIDVNDNEALADYIYYILTQKEIIEYLQSIAEQSVSTYPTIKSSDIEDLNILLPDIDAQKKIVSILSIIDKKIEINKLINGNLEEQALLLFETWFINFEGYTDEMYQTEFGKIPGSFRLIKNKDLPMLITDYVANGSFASLKANVTLYQQENYAYFIRNTDLKSGKYGVFVDQYSYEFLLKSKLFGGELIISNVGDVGSVFLCPKLNKPMTLGNNMIMLRPEQENLNYYLYIWFKWGYGKSLIQGITGGSAQPKFNKTDFKNLLIYLPDEVVLERFHQLVQPMYKLIENNNIENQMLIDIRNSLLPKLLSGEVDISNIKL